jgi:short-subunit dehydrogenase
MNIIITGAGSGIGKATAKAISSLGNHHVLAIGRDEEKLHALQEEIKATNPSVLITTFVFDLKSQEGKFLNLAKQIKKTCNHIDILINNAGAFISKPFVELAPSDWQLLFETNIFAAAQMIKVVLPMLVKSSQANIINIGSMGGFQGSQKFPGLSAYCASKAALVAFTECISQELPTHIHCNCLCFGSVETKMFQNAFPENVAAMTTKDTGEFIAHFALQNWKLFNGKVIPIAAATP